MIHFLQPLAIRSLLVMTMLGWAWLPGRAAVHTGVWSVAPVQFPDDASQDRPPLQPALAGCDVTASCADVNYYLYQNNYFKSLSVDSFAVDPSLQTNRHQLIEDGPSKGWLTSVLEGLGGMMEPGTAAISVLGLLAFGISSLNMQGRNPSPRKRKYRALR